MTKRYFGPFTILVDDENELTRVELVRVGPKAWQLTRPEIEGLRAYVLTKASEYGYRVIEV